MAITPLPPAPEVTDSAAEFNTKAFALVNALNPFVTETNALAVQVDADAVTASEGAEAAEAALAAANFKGEWSTLTGALAIPASVSHNGSVWILTQSLADVTSNEPGVDSPNYWISVTIPSQTGNDGKFLSTDGTDLAWSFPSPNTIAEEFTSSGTWTKPANVTFVRVFVVGAGGGGGSGGKTNTSFAGGGAGGGGGGSNDYIFLASELTSTVTVTIGAGGAGGAARTTADTAGAAGAAGGATTFGSFLRANGGAGGGGGPAGSAAVGALAEGGGTLSGRAFAPDGATSKTPISLPAGPSSSRFGGSVSEYGSEFAGAGGGNGGRVFSGAAISGTDGGSQKVETGGGGAGGGVAAAGTTTTTAYSGGGGGGGSGTSSNAGAGGGGGRASGGGGGGGVLNTFSFVSYASGAGGTGGNGFARIVAW